MYTLKVDQPNLPAGTEIHIPGLGAVKNGETREVSKEEADAYRAFHRTLDEDGNVVPGPTLLAAAANMYGVEVNTASSQQKPVEKKGSDD